MKKQMSAQKMLDLYNSPITSKDQFPTLYDFLLYVTGGDFGLLNDSELISSALIEASLKETMLQTMKIKANDSIRINTRNC